MLSISIIKKRYKIFYETPKALYSGVIAMSALILSLFVNYYAGTYATEKASNSVTDIILSNIPVFNVDEIFLYGSVVLVVFIAGFIIVDPKRIPFTLNSIALFVVIRSIFISLTHIGPFPDKTILELGNIFDKFLFGGDLFFSGHTGLPFLMALIFWKDIYPRYIFLAFSITLGTSALLGHFHYSIDVLAAFFITYTIFHIAEKVFGKERALFFSNSV